MRTDDISQRLCDLTDVPKGPAKKSVDVITSSGTIRINRIGKTWEIVVRFGCATFHTAGGSVVRVIQSWREDGESGAIAVGDNTGNEFRPRGWFDVRPEDVHAIEVAE